jgi:agmatinase
MFVVKVPGINGLGKTKGCERAGNAIIEALQDIHSNESGKDIDANNLNLEEIHLDNNNLELSNKLIYKNAFESFEKHPKVIFLGGDHSISYPLTRAFFDYCENQNPVKKPCLIVFDAHADCMPAMKEPTHEEWLRKLIEDGFPVENILLIGTRNLWKAEKEFLKEKGIRVISVNNINEDLQEMTDIITEFANGKELYCSIDIDVIDPSAAPSTGYAEPGGLTSRQLLYILQRINKIKSLHGLDIVEINEIKDKERDNITVKLGAKMLAEVM